MSNPNVAPFIATLALIIVIFVAFGIWLVARQNQFIKEFIEANRKSADSFENNIRNINNQFLREMKENAKEHKSSEVRLFNTFTRIRNAIKENCITTMEDVGACRLAVYLLHNGSMSTHGVRFFKMSCICERILRGSGVREQSINQANIPINLFDDMIDGLIEDGSYIILNDENVENTNHKIFISAHKIVYSLAVAMFDANNNILGFVLVEMDHHYDKALIDDEKKKLDILINQLVPILSYSDYVNSNLDFTETPSKSTDK